VKLGLAQKIAFTNGVVHAARFWLLIAEKSSSPLAVAP
jgi:hypothetical protein